MFVASRGRQFVSHGSAGPYNQQPFPHASPSCCNPNPIHFKMEHELVILGGQTSTADSGGNDESQDLSDATHANEAMHSDHETDTDEATEAEDMTHSGEETDEDKDGDDPVEVLKITLGQQNPTHALRPMGFEFRTVIEVRCEQFAYIYFDDRWVTYAETQDLIRGWPYLKARIVDVRLIYRPLTLRAPSYPSDPLGPNAG
jgi:hypothetical protein